ncbi:MAG: putative phosphoadenosine phosphosulfate reductase [Pseudonocardiales bacterium]|nr:putative phosphoadenosine phosphosulfate reductase [Pseudonocardiales bacterium]
MSAPTALRASLRELAERAGAELEGASAQDILQWAQATLGDSWCVASSMADGVMAHLASQVRPGVDVVFLDTGYHFAETMGMADAMSVVLPITLKTILPLRTVAEQDAEHGKDLFARNPDACCAMRKVEPLERGLAPYAGWVSGLRRDEAITRANTKVVEWDEKRQMVKLNPIATWNQAAVDIYMSSNGILENPLLSDGYGSVGCFPCTARVAEGEDARAGRWAGTNKIECGLHT